MHVMHISRNTAAQFITNTLPVPAAVFVHCILRYSVLDFNSGLPVEGIRENKQSKSFYNVLYGVIFLNHPVIVPMYDQWARNLKIRVRGYSIR